MTLGEILVPPCVLVPPGYLSYRLLSTIPSSQLSKDLGAAAPVWQEGGEPRGSACRQADFSPALT